MDEAAHSGELRVTGLNHLTLAVTDLDRSIAFYRDVLGCTLRAAWPAGAYLEAGSLWLCLSVEPQRQASSRGDYTHYAFDVPAQHFAALAARIAPSPRASFITPARRMQA